MASIFFISAILVFISLILCLSGFIYFYLRSRQYKHKLKSIKLSLKKSEANANVLQEKINELQNKLNKIFHDPVTQLFGWDLFKDRLEHSIQESVRYQLIMAILVIDIDDFKKTNQALGDEAGDTLLKEVGKRIQSCIRKVDSASRFKEDTFVVLLTQLAKQESAAIIAQRILQAMADPILIETRELYITIGIGIALYPSDGKESAVLLRNADYALHLAKESGVGHYQFYQKELYANSQRDLALLTSLNKGTFFQEISVLYQPIYNCSTNQVISMEMQLRWEHPEWEMVNEDELFKMAKQQRKLGQLSEWLITAACQSFKKWEKNGFHPDFISMPLSIYQLEDSHFIHELSRSFQQQAFDPVGLLFKIKENFSTIPLEILEKSFNMLKYIGIKVAIDKFGVEPFSLCYLKKLSIGYLKLDHFLIQDVSTNLKSQAIVKSILNLAKNLSIQVIVPGVESKDQMNALKELGFLLISGKYLGTPMDENAVLAHMSKYEAHHE